MAIFTCASCGREFKAQSNRKRRYCNGACFRAQEAREGSARRATWSPERRRASNVVWTAIWRGEIKRQPCERCGKFPADAHHDDYSKPLDVRWLCRAHHRQHHEAERRALADKPLQEFLAQRAAIAKAEAR